MQYIIISSLFQYFMDGNQILIYLFEKADFKSHWNCITIFYFGYNKSINKIFDCLFLHPCNAEKKKKTLI